MEEEEEIMDPVLNVIDDIIHSIESNDKEFQIKQIPSRKDILNLHLAFIKTLMIL